MKSATLLSAVFFLPILLHAATIHVPGDYPTIQAAINAAASGDTILVAPGTYPENINVKKSLSLIGGDKDTTVIDGGGSGTVAWVTADAVSISGFTIQNSGGQWPDAGLLLNNTGGHDISGNIIKNNMMAIHGSDSSDNVIAGNRIADSSFRGVAMYSYTTGCANITFSNNEFTNNKSPVYLESSHQSVIDGNTFSGSYDSGIVINDSDNVAITNNTLTNDERIEPSEGVGYMISGNKFTECYGGVHLFKITQSQVSDNIFVKQHSTAISLSESDGNVIEDNTIGLGYSGHGISMAHANNNELKGNDISWGWNGIHVHGDSNLVTGNTVRSCLYNGIDVTFSQQTICNNVIQNCGQDGIQIMSGGSHVVHSNLIISSGEYGIVVYTSFNKIFHNNLIDNDQSARTMGSNLVNQWDDGYPSGGNYWDDYIGKDLDGDGIGDTPYLIYGGGQDNYPLMEPLNPPPSNVLNADTGELFITIQSAINDKHTLDGHTLLVGSGTYYEDVTIDKSIVLKGDDKETTHIDGGNQVSTVEVNANGVMLSGFTVLNGRSVYAGVTINSDFNMVYGNNINDNTGKGVLIEGGAYNIISGNLLSDNIRDAIFMISAHDNCIVGNEIISTAGYSGISLNTGSFGNLVSGNSITDSAEKGIEITDYAYGNWVCSNTVQNSGEVGVKMFEYCHDNTVCSNIIQNSGDTGILVHDYAYDNRIYHNSVFNSTKYNGYEEYVCTGISWDNGYPSGGNYWDDYTGDDNFSGPHQNIPGSDGIGDTHYKIDGWSNAKDFYPLMNPFNALAVDTHTLSAGKGGCVTFSLDAGPLNGHRNYLLLGSVTGASPGIPLPGGQVTLPLNWDFFTGIVLSYLNTPLFEDFMGTLDGSGTAQAKFDTLMPVPGTAGIIMTFDYALNKPWNFASDPVTVVMLP